MKKPLTPWGIELAVFWLVAHTTNTVKLYFGPRQLDFENCHCHVFLTFAYKGLE
jgi:hypothetical protein